MPPQRPAVPNFGFALAVFNPSVTETVPLAGGCVTVTVTLRASQALFQNVRRESTTSAPESTVRATVLNEIGPTSELTAGVSAPNEVGASSLAQAVPTTSGEPVAAPSNNAATMMARVMA